MPHQIINTNKRTLLSILSIALIYHIASSSFSQAANEQQPLRPWLKNRGLLSRSAPANPPPIQAAAAAAAQASATSSSPAPIAAAAAPSSPAHQTENASPHRHLSSSLSSQSGSALTSGTGSAVEVPAPITTTRVLAAQKIITPTTTTTNNRTTRTAEIFDHNIIVTNTCERESMKVNLRMNRDFYGVIHTRNQRSKQICSIEGTGDREYNLEISHVLNQQDPNYCGVIKARKDSPDDKDILSVVIAVRLHRKIELPDDKFFLLNCTNRCRKADCSTPAAKLTDLNNADLNDETTSVERENAEKANSDARDRNPGLNSDECTIWKFPWVITLLWALGILLLAMVISQCIMCSSMICRCVKTEVEEREPSVYEGDSDDYDDDNNLNVNNKSKHYKEKKSTYTIDYDNRDIYKTSNNYAPYNLEEAQTRSSSRNQKRHRKASR